MADSFRAAQLRNPCAASLAHRAAAASAVLDAATCPAEAAGADQRSGIALRRLGHLLPVACAFAASYQARPVDVTDRLALDGIERDRQGAWVAAGRW